MERFAAIDFETANGKRSSICSIGIAILEDDWVVDSIYTLVRPTPNFYTRWTTAIHGLTAEDTNDALCFEEAWESIASTAAFICFWFILPPLPFHGAGVRAAWSALPWGRG